VEDAIAADHPDRAAIRGNVIYWNFLPPDELDDLLKLYANTRHLDCILSIFAVS
jgi:hypothetical protein